MVSGRNWFLIAQPAAMSVANVAAANPTFFQAAQDRDAGATDKGVAEAIAEAAGEGSLDAAAGETM
jgi:hypothetical protein